MTYPVHRFGAMLEEFEVVDAMFYGTHLSGSLLVGATVRHYYIVRDMGGMHESREASPFFSHALQKAGHCSSSGERLCFGLCVTYSDEEEVRIGPPYGIMKNFRIEHTKPSAQYRRSANMDRTSYIMS